MAARITEVRDAVVAKIAAWWVPGAPDAVAGVSRVDVDSATLTGRKVYVFRSAYTRPAVTRGEDVGDYTIAVMVVERYAAVNDPTEAWVNARVDWCDELLELLGDARGDRLLVNPAEPGSGLWPESAVVTTVCDIEELAVRKLFVSFLTFVFREHAAA